MTMGSGAGSGAQGDRVRRVDGIPKVTGVAQYLGDIRVPRMLYARLVHSSVHHGNIRSIRAESAFAISGVRAVVTGAELEVPERLSRNGGQPPLLATRVVRFVGEPLCAVVAETAGVAEVAARLVEIEYDTLPTVPKAPDLAQLCAVPIHAVISESGGGSLSSPSYLPAGADIIDHCHTSWGEPTIAFRRAAAVIDDDFEFPSVGSHSLEGPCVIVADDGTQVTVWSNTNEPFRVREELAECFRLSPQRVRVIVPHVGGAFSGRRGLRLELLAAALAKKLGRPVQVALTPRQFSRLAGRPRLHVTLRSSIGREGTISARHIAVAFDAGICVEEDLKWEDGVVGVAAGLYPCPSGIIDGILVRSHRPPLHPFRGDVAPPLVWALEMHTQRIAAQLAVDTSVLRRMHFACRLPLLTNASTPSQVDWEGLLNIVGGDISPTGAVAGMMTGEGIALGVKHGGGSNPYGCVMIARLHQDGTVTVSAGAVETGGGVATLLAHVVAETLGCPIGDVRVELSDTLLTPYDEGGGGGRTTIVCGRAVQQAAVALRCQLVAFAARHWEAPEDAIEVRDGRVWWEEQTLTFAALLAQVFGSRGGDLLARDYARPAGAVNEDEGHGPVFWAAGAARARVEVDRETGEISVTHIVASADVGHVLLRPLCEGQIDGASMMAVGHALFEGQMASAEPTDHPLTAVARVPTFCDLPDVTVRFLEHADGPGPFGAKGVSETGMLAVGAAIANAVGRAVGVEVGAPPLTPESVWRAMRKKPTCLASV